MDALSKLKLSPDQTEFIVFGSKVNIRKCPLTLMSVFLEAFFIRLTWSKPRLWFDAEFSFSEHVKYTCKACFLQMCDLCRIRQYLTSEVAVLAANALVGSRLNYCNSLFRGFSCLNQHKLRSIQNTLAHIVTNHRKYAHVTPVLKKFHWLPVKYCCMFKIATLVYKFSHRGSPSYFEPFLNLSSCS